MSPISEYTCTSESKEDGLDENSVVPCPELKYKTPE